ncbi:uncharacterized protein N7529_003496 [Penicillium soppii]|uniref:uncharacterized protein n=1 Tax=Penicillium soppii TaxID=69789 RepID=UPI0025474791|nr:uncharacterized protein N7529_003496 [Penicillium soppii]KAJ5871143.1 hypothetical protein N7529_003496 [Penicillium soppii]
MELALVKRLLVRSSTPCIPRLTRASVHGNAQSENKGDQKFNVGATFPDDFEDSPLKSEILQKQNPNPGIEDSYHPTMEDIYESVRGKSTPRSAKAAKPAQEEEREPGLDEM